MGSKKHKKDSKKKKHKSKSQSPLEAEERERKKHRKHKDRKRDRSPDVEEVPVDSHLQKNDVSEIVSPRSRSASVERDRRMREHHHHHRSLHDIADTYRDASHEPERDRERSPIATASKAKESLSIEETNRLRAKLGLKPLEVAEKPADDGKFKDDLGEFYHKPAVSITQQKKTDKLKEKLEQRKEKRNLEKKLETTLLAEESDDDDAIAWVQRSREIEQQKREAAKRAAMLDEMDEVFGVSALVAEEVNTIKQHSYTDRDLQGLRVAHDIDALGDERETVLTLADKEVLAEDGEDVLVNVNIVDNEKYKKNIEDRKKARAGYQAYDEEAELEASLGFQRPVLSKYDEHIDQGKQNNKGFRIGDDDAIEAKKFRELMRRERIAGGVDKRLESLHMPELRIASDYMDEHELQAKFKKPKRKGKMRKKQTKEEPIDVDDYDEGVVPLDTDDTEVNPKSLPNGLAVDEEETEPDTELQAALARARRLRQVELADQKPFTMPKEEPEEEETGGGMVFDATAEFCRALGDIPTYGQSGNREHLPQPMDEGDEADANGDADIESDPEGGAGAWSRVDLHTDKQPDLTAGSSVALDAEPSLGCGVGGALQLALSKGYLERPGAGPATRTPDQRLLTALAARNYSIEDKTYAGEDDKYGRRERGQSGPLQEFREKYNFKPTIKLEYVDDDGRPLPPKEAFRYLSHKFHGKGPGKNKQEKRIKKAVQEGLMKKMSSTDTPLNTLQMLQDKQKETHSPYIVLSGAKREQNN